jgi:hypothetical protein
MSLYEKVLRHAPPHTQERRGEERRGEERRERERERHCMDFASIALLETGYCYGYSHYYCSN